MKLLLLVLASLAVSPYALADAETESSRCVSLPPLCPPGSYPICICQSAMSLTCGWLCGSR